MAERPISTLNKPDVALEMTLRLSLFSEFTGQPNGFPGEVRAVGVHAATTSARRDGEGELSKRNWSGGVELVEWANRKTNHLAQAFLFGWLLLV